MASVSLDEMFEKAKQAYPHGFQRGDTVWELVDAYVATKNYAFDGQLILQSRQALASGQERKSTYTNFRLDEAELE
ncbi:MAG TPA: hypothetical protein PKD98_15615 [Anaerolineae bacterium]|nr:hypothetical protein [Anaerolineae bacterium]